MIKNCDCNSLNLCVAHQIFMLESMSVSEADVFAP